MTTLFKNKIPALTKTQGNDMLTERLQKKQFCYLVCLEIMNYLFNDIEIDSMIRAGQSSIQLSTSVTIKEQTKGPAPSEG